MRELSTGIVARAVDEYYFHVTYRFAGLASGDVVERREVDKPSTIKDFTESVRKHAILYRSKDFKDLVAAALNSSTDDYRLAVRKFCREHSIDYEWNSGNDIRGNLLQYSQRLEAWAR